MRWLLLQQASKRIRIAIHDARDWNLQDIEDQRIDVENRCGVDDYTLRQAWAGSEENAMHVR